MSYVPTSKKAYQRHVYSGPRKSLKRVRGGLRQFYVGESRLKVWRSEETKKKPVKKEIFTYNNSIVVQKSEIEMLLIKLEPPEYYKQHTQGESSTTAAASSIRLKEELEEGGMLGETEVKLEKIEIGEEGFQV